MNNTVSKVNFFSLVQNFINELKKNFKIKIEEIEIIKEDTVFKTPGKLN